MVLDYLSTTLQRYKKSAKPPNISATFFKENNPALLCDKAGLFCDKRPLASHRSPLKKILAEVLAVGRQLVVEMVEMIP